MVLSAQKRTEMYLRPNLITFFTLCCMCMMVETLPGDCNFNTDLCTWRNDDHDTMEWILNRGPTTTGGTGPFSDHTSPGKAGKYIYIESSGKKPGDYARLISETFHNQANRCLTFWYHMYGKPGSLHVGVTVNQSQPVTLLNITGDHGNNWIEGSVYIPDRFNDFQIVFDGFRGSSYLGDIALDDISFTGICNVPPAESTTITPEMSTTTTTPRTTEIFTTITTTKTTEKLTTFSPPETTVSTARSSSPDPTTYHLETTTSAETASPDDISTSSTLVTTTAAKITSPVNITTSSTLVTTAAAKTTSSTLLTTTAAKTTSPGDKTTSSTLETITAAKTTSVDDKTTYKSTQHLTRTSTQETIIFTHYCPVEQFESINWWKTAAGETDIKECPPNYTGNASRQCDSNGNWGTPVYIYCVNEILHKTTEKLKKLEQITNPEQAAAAISDILDTVDNTTGDHNEKPLKSGDLKQTTSILSSIIQIGNSKNASVNSEKFADVLNSVLNTENSHSWNEVNTHDDSEKGASSIMRIVDSLGSLVQKNLSSNETKIINRKNLVIEISTLKKNLSFPSDVHSRSKLLLADQPALKDKFYTAAMYKTLSGILPTTVNRSVGSDVMSVSFDKAIHNLAENISITFERNKKVKFIDPKISCGYWNFSSRIWTYDGCYLKMSDSKVSTCTCNHLTNFAILMSPSDVEISDASKKALEIITFVGCGLSILGCFLTLIIYAVFWRFVKHEWAVILMHMCIVLIIGYSVFLSATEETENDVACIIITGVLHYVFLVVFFLMLCNGISVARSVIYVFKTKSRLPIYIAVAWVVPLLIVGITLGITRLKGYHSEKYCWLNTSNFVFMSFVGPALLIILMNIGTIIIVLRAVYSRKGIQNETLKKKARDGIKCMVTLLPVLGLSWLFGILAFNEDTIIFQYLFGITTSCQGLFIFIFHTVLSKKVQEGFRQTMHRRRAKSMSNFSSKPKSSGTHDRFDSKVCTRLVDNSNTDSTILKDMKKETQKKYEIRAFLKLNKSQAYEVAKA
ncbi:adhesion G protein-coupled receptor L3-like isoform X5 [Mytilus galloprovincialis]|uniref:adhesion G protein-coupled receptor L3-like isoform X5 n=1 Tax=Mytilus galloprovincialis TaxID=29158 RepID=UPI003F7B476D